MNKRSFLALLMLLPFLLGAAILRDPTQPPNYQGVDSSRNVFNLSAIFIYPTHRFAIINDQTMVVGEKIGDYTITAIESNTVELVGTEGKKEILQLVIPVREMTKEAAHD